MTITCKTTLVALAAAAVLCLAGQAQAVGYSGTTTGAPTFNRPMAGAPPTSLSGVATAVRYSAQSFTVSTSGTYQFLSIAIGGWDNFSLLYQNTFVPTSSLTNVLVGNDDYLNDINNIGVSGFSAALVAGTPYFYVTTGFSNTSFGAFTDSITGPGLVTLPQVPEPGSRESMALGLAVLALTARRIAAKRQEPS